MRRRVFISVLVFLISIFAVQIYFGYILIRHGYIKETRSSLRTFIERVKTDLEFTDGKLKMDKYLADPLTPHPNGSSGFNKPLYIISADGFVIERNLPINGFLDVSDFKHLMTFNEPKFVEHITNERWRVLSKPLIYNNEIQGVITVAAYNPQESNLPQIDNKLLENINDLENKVSFKENNLDINLIDIRNIKYDVSFEIVTKYNKVLLNNGRTPSFIDQSYVYDAFSNKEKFVYDDITQKQYLVEFLPILNNLNKPQAIIVAADNLDELNVTLNNYLISSILIWGLAILPITFIFVLKLINWIVKEKAIIYKKMPESIFFDKQNSALIIDGVKINIPYASNQYYLIQALIGSPTKRWEVDELQDRMSGSIEAKSPRSVYDAAIALNKKFAWKLIDYNRKTYRLNPELRTSLK